MKLIADGFWAVGVALSLGMITLGAWLVVRLVTRRAPAIDEPKKTAPSSRQEQGLRVPSFRWTAWHGIRSRRSAIIPVSVAVPSVSDKQVSRRAET
jgi:hypothetical protein